MPRPKSEITNQDVFIHVRVTHLQRIAFAELGGANWLRKLLREKISSTPFNVKGKDEITITRTKSNQDKYD